MFVAIGYLNQNIIFVMILLMTHEKIKTTILFGIFLFLHFVPSFAQVKKSSKKIEKSIKNLDSITTYSKDTSKLYNATFTLGRIYYKDKKQFKTAKKYFLQALSLTNKKEHKTNLAQIYLNLGYTNNKLAMSDSTLIYYNKSLQLFYELKNFKEISRVNSNIARLYSREQKKEAAQYFRDAILYGKKSNRALCTTYNNFGNYYLDQKELDSALFYYNHSLRRAQKTHQTQKLLRAQINIGITLLEQNKHSKAYKTLLKAEKIAQEKKYGRLLYFVHFHLGRYYTVTKQQKKAAEFYEKSLNAYNVKKDYLKQMEVLQMISDFYHDTNNYKDALIYAEKYHHIKDSVLSQKKIKAFDDIRTKYEVEKSEIKIEVLTKEKQLDKSRNTSIFFGFLFFISFLLLLTYFLRNKIKTQSLLRKKEHEEFVNELEAKKEISHKEGEESERKRLSKELHDGLGGQLSGIKTMLHGIDKDNIEDATKKLDQQLGESIKNLRHISHDLSANFLKDKEYNVLLHKVIKQILEDSIQTEISLFPVDILNELNDHYKLNIYRILQEICSNIVKHAKANIVSISLSISDEINILVEDNGIGYNTNMNYSGIGLQNINDRLASMQGTITVESKPSIGTIIIINIPYET